MKKQLIFTLLFVLVTYTTFSQRTEVDLGAFNELKVYDQMNVTLIKSSENKAIITGDNVDDVVIDNDKGTLKIRMDVENSLDGNETLISLHYSDELKLIDVNEGAEVTSKDPLTAKNLVLRAQEGAEMNISVKSTNVDSKAVTGGKIKVTGTAENQEVLIRTGGEFYGEAFRTNRTEVKVFAGGKAIVNAKELMKAKVTAGGKIEIYGNPNKIDEDKTFGGSIVKKQ